MAFSDSEVVREEMLTLVDRITDTRGNVKSPVKLMLTGPHGIDGNCQFQGIAVLDNPTPDSIEVRVAAGSSPKELYDSAVAAGVTTETRTINGELAYAIKLSEAGSRYMILRTNYPGSHFQTLGQIAGASPAGRCEIYLPTVEDTFTYGLLQAQAAAVRGDEGAFLAHLQALAPTLPAAARVGLGEGQMGDRIIKLIMAQAIKLNLVHLLPVVFSLPPGNVQKVEDAMSTS
jgi:hypothetical protein